MAALHREYVSFPSHEEFVGQCVSVPRDVAEAHLAPIASRLAAVCLERQPIHLLYSTGKPRSSTTVYTGTAGLVVFFTRYLTMQHRHPALLTYDPLVPKALDALLSQHLPRLREGVPREGGGFYCGLPGELIAAIGAVATRCSAEDDSLHKELTQRLLALADSVAGETCAGVNEVLYGRAGYLIALSHLYRYGLQVPERTVEAAASKVAMAMLADGVAGAWERWPLMWSFHGKRYLGAAHGVSGILYALLCWWSVLPPPQRELVLGTLNRLLEHVVAPTCVSKADSDPAVTEELVHWCHGLPGHVMLFVKAHMLFGTSRYLSAVERGCDKIVRLGALRKGLGLCHGVCGNAYALLSAFRLTGHPRYLHHAQAMFRLTSEPHYLDAVASYDDPQRLRMGVPDVPDSLMEGVAGVGCFLLDLLEPHFSCFPGYETSTVPPVLQWLHPALSPPGVHQAAWTGRLLAPGVWSLPFMHSAFCERLLEDVYSDRPGATRKVDALRLGSRHAPVVRAVAAAVERFAHSVMLPANSRRLVRAGGNAPAAGATVPNFAQFRGRKPQAFTAALDATRENSGGGVWDHLTQVPQLTIWRAYIIRYDSESHPSIQSHADACDITFNLCLRRTTTRGHLVFNASGTHYQHEVGEAVVFWGDKVHHTHNVTPGGERAQLVLLLNFMREATPPRRLDAALLSDDVLQDIMLFLPLKDIALVAYASRRLHSLASADSLWFQLYRRNADLSSFRPPADVRTVPLCRDCGAAHTLTKPVVVCCECGQGVHPRGCGLTPLGDLDEPDDSELSTARCAGCARDRPPTERRVPSIFHRLRGTAEDLVKEAVRHRFANDAAYQLTQGADIVAESCPWKTTYRAMATAAGKAEEYLRTRAALAERSFWRAIIGTYSIHNMRSQLRLASPGAHDSPEAFMPCGECFDDES
jgi:hypothetical protein